MYFDAAAGLRVGTAACAGGVYRLGQALDSGRPCSSTGRPYRSSSSGKSSSCKSCALRARLSTSGQRRVDGGAVDAFVLREGGRGDRLVAGFVVLVAIGARPSLAVGKLCGVAQHRVCGTKVTSMLPLKW